MADGLHTAIGEVVPAIVSTLQGSLSFSVFDSGTTGIPSDTKYVIIAGTKPDPQEPDDEISEMHQQWHGLGRKGRLETISIRCLAVGRAPTFTAARTLALDAIEQVALNLPEKPSTHTYNALVGEVMGMSKVSTPQGCFMYAMFNIDVEARLVP
jgi:hypothetical protein